jgi:hypothetical protein
MTRIVILVPQGLRTGGPEACFQLSDMLFRHGWRPEMWLITSVEQRLFAEALQGRRDITEQSIAVPLRDHGIDEYRRYQWKPFTGTTVGQSNLFVIPEIYLSWLPALGNSRTLVWWLSVDYAFRSLSEVNSNYLRMATVRHAAQSAYAKAFLAALGLTDVAMLSDYTVIHALEKGRLLSSRPLRAVYNAGSKVIGDISRFAAQLAAATGAEVSPIRGLQRCQVYDAFATSRLFVDLGNFPGKDRMAREALLLGANVLIAASGSGAYEEDFPIPEQCRVSVHNISEILGLAAQMLFEPAAFQDAFEPARQQIRAEESVFAAETVSVFRSLA